MQPDNYPEPGKRPLSSITPIIIENPDGSFYLAAGGSGGSKIFPSVFQAILNLDWGMDASESVEFGRLHDQLYPARVDADSIYPGPLLDALRQRGHNVTGWFLFVLLVRPTVRVDNESSFGYQPGGRSCSASCKGRRYNMG